MTAIEARQQVQAAIDALVETPRDVEDGLIRILEQVVGLLRSPHPYDAGQKGRTLSFGIDALRAWCAAWEALNVSDTHGFGGADVWHELCLRIVEIFNLPLFSGSQRMRTLTMRMCARFDTMGCASLPPFASMLLDEANKSEFQAQFMIQEALLAHYGMRILSKPPSEFYMHVLHGIQQGFGHISRRSHLAITFMEHAPMNDWLEPLARVLCTSEDRGIEHLVAHVVHPWLDRKPEVLQPMLDALKEERVKMYVLQAAKMHHLCVVEEMVPGKVRIPIDMLQTCLVSSSSRMRVGALSLCVEARTPSMLLTLPERQMILQFFQHCLHLSSAVARKDTIALFVKLLVRIRTSCHKMKDQRVQEMQHFVHSLYQYMVHAMHPGAPYPSTILGVSLLFLLFEATTPPKETSPLPLLHESVLRDAVRALYKAQKTYPATALAPIAASGPLMHRLLYLATESTYDDVQSTAALILLRRSSHANSFWDDREFVWQHIVSKSWQLLTAPKESDAHAGLQLLKLYHKACVPDMHEFLLIRMGGKACGDWTCSLMDVHAGRLEAQLDEAKESFAHASHKGIHGTVAALAYLAEAADTVPLQRMHDLIQRVWTLVSPYLCAAAPENAEAEEEDQVHESPVSQRILSFSWRAMKEVAALHEVCALSHMTEDTVQEASDLFLTWLLSIRHRGAFSMVYPRYHGMARAICEQGGHGPDAWLKACMERVDRDASQFSTTRRSAGLGYAVLALLSAHKGKKLMDLTASTMRRLLSMAMGHECIRTIHALNVMRVLVMDSSIASAMRSHLGEALACAVTSFRSVHWSVRNAAMMLFSAISTRYFGTSAFGRRANMRGAKLETLWRESDALADALQSTLGTCMQDQDADEGHGSALYAVLCLFSRSDASMCTDTMLDMLYRCTRSKHAAVRTLAAQCCATLTPAEQRYDTGARLLREASTRDQNALAGALAILEHWASPVYKEMVLSRMDLLEENACPVTMASFLQVAERCGAQGHVRPWLLSWLEKTKPQDPFMAWFLPVACRMVWDALPMSLLQGPDRAMMIGMLSAEPELIARMPWDQHDVVNMLEDVLWDAQMPLQARTQAAHVLDMLHASLDAQALLTLCLSTEHVPLREALLPLLGRAVQPDTLEPCLWILDACAKEEAPRASRLGVARALARMEETSHVRKDVLVIRLLHDDDPDVREAACALCDTSDRVMKRGPDACTQDLWQKHLHEPAFQAYVWQMLVPTTCTYAPLTWAATREDDPSLFPTEAANQYHDAVSDVLRAFRVCMTLAPHPHLRVWADEARGHLDRDVDLVRPGAYLMHLQRACLVRLAWAAGLLDDMSWVLRVCRDRLLLPPMDEWGLSEEPGEPTSPPSVGPLRIA